MALKIISIPKLKENPKQLVCKCGTIFEWNGNPEDVVKTLSYPESHAIRVYEEYVCCPVCREKVLARWWYKDFL